MSKDFSTLSNCTDLNTLHINERSLREQGTVYKFEVFLSRVLMIEETFRLPCLRLVTTGH